MPDLVPPIRVAVIGAGYFGRFHYDAWSRMPEVTLAAVCERDPEKARAVAEDYGAPGQPLPIFSDVRAMLEAVQPDLVDITAPPAAHMPLLEALVPKVGHIICQKPFCAGFQAASEAVALAARHGTRIAVHENIRFQPWNEEAKRLLDRGLIGTPWQVSFRLRPGDG
ncbi:MAG: Gfo/Idh/MocA family oxidoreductase, partial [Pseudomonadota bacterium]